jgi:hypothetical protein
MSTLSIERSRLINALGHCAAEAEHCASTATGLRDTEDCISSCHDAAQLCRVAAEFLARGSSFEHWVLLASVLACDYCARECESQLGAFFADCASACRRVVRLASSLGDSILAEREWPDDVSDTEVSRPSSGTWVHHHGP